MQNQVYSGKEDIVVDFGNNNGKEERKSTSPIGAFSPQRPSSAAQAFPPQNFSVLPPQ